MKQLKLVVFAFFIVTLAFAQKKGTLTGVITDKNSNNAPISFVNVYIKETKTSVTSNEKGKYSITLNEGTYTVQFSSVGFESISKIATIKSGETTTLNSSMGSGNYVLSDVIIKKNTGSREKETAILLDQKNAVVFKQSIGAQEMSRKGVSDVEEGLTKITGITKVESRGLFVRGLEDRYNSLLLNGLAVPSNNPFKKIIALDIFPTDIVSVLETYKTFNTNLYGDFAGATFNIVTAGSGKSQTKINFGVGFTTNNNLKEFLISQDATSNSDFFGFSGNERNLPSFLSNKTPSFQDLTTEQSNNAFGSGFDVQNKNSPLNTSFGILHSEKFNVGKNNNIFQYLFSLNYDNKFQIRSGVDRVFNPSGLGNYDNDLFTTQYKFVANSSVLAAMTYKTNRLTLTSNTTYLKSNENLIQDQLGYTNGNATQTNGFIRMNQLQENTFFNTQLFGNFKLTQNERHNLKAGISYSVTNFELPDRKSFAGVKIDNITTSIGYSANSLTRQYLDFDGDQHISSLFEYSFIFGNKEINKAHKLVIGYSGYINNMGSDFRFLVPKNNPNIATFETNKPDRVLKNEILKNNLTYRDGSNPTYKAMLEEFINAGYFDLGFKFLEKFELNFGGRIEQTYKETKYRSSGSFDVPFENVTIDRIDILPTLNTKYIINQTSNLRFAASKTITRPVIMEAYPLEFVNPDGTIEQGNPLLINSDNFNFDLKYELFPTNKELISLTFFSKIIQNPIERLFTNSAGSGGQITTYGNSKKALLYGTELEFLFQLQRISKSLSNFSFGANASLMDTNVSIEKIFKNNVNNPETISSDDKPSRKLQGASPWILNADIKYDSEFSKSWKSSMTMVYNIYSKRIFAVGTNGLDSFYEMPYGKLDFIWQNNISKKIDVKFSIDNILDPSYKIEMGKESRVKITESDLTVRDFKKGTGFSINVSYTF